jgi:hypothetical protein
MGDIEDLRSRMDNLERRIRAVEARPRQDRTWLDIGPVTLKIIGAAVLFVVVLLVLARLR